MTAQPFVGEAEVHWIRVFADASIAVMGFLGLDAISTLSEESKNPSDKGMVGRSILTVLLVAGVLSINVSWDIGSLMPAIQIQDPATAVFDLLGATVGSWAPTARTWALAIVVGFTNTLPMLAGISRVLHAMGRDRQWSSVFAQVHGASSVPRAALLTSTAASTSIAFTLRNQDQRSLFFHLVALGLGLITACPALTGMHPMAI